MLSQPNRKSQERLECPAHFQRRLTQVGGLNRYRQPNFKLAWAQTETVHRENLERTGYSDFLLGDGLPHWMLLQWVDAGKCHELPHLRPQSDVGYYEENRDEKTGLQILGEYPYQGRYEIVQNLLAKVFVNGQMFIQAFPLSTEIVEMIVPIIKASMGVSLQAKLQFLKDQEEKEEDDRSREFDDLWHDIHRKSTLATTRWLEDRQRLIERTYNAALVAKMQRDKFFQAQGRLQNA